MTVSSPSGCRGLGSARVVHLGSVVRVVHLGASARSLAVVSALSFAMSLGLTGMARCLGLRRF